MTGYDRAMVVTESGEGRTAPTLLVGPRLAGPRAVAATLAMTVLLTGCVVGEADDAGSDTLMVSDRLTEEGSYSMAIPSIDEIIDEVGDADLAAVVVPTDRALLALDADRLAELAGDGDLVSLIVLLPTSDLIDLASPDAIVGAETVIIGSDGTAYRLENDGSTQTFADQPIRTVERRGTVTIIAVDGIVER